MKFCKNCKSIPVKDIPFENIRKDGTRKARLLKERGHRCEECGITDWKGRPAPLQLDHIDGNPGNNGKDNLRIICPNCHAMTDTYAGKNVGKFPGTDRQKKFMKYPTQKYRNRMKNMGS